MDDVVGLGHFLELEVVLRDDQTEGEGRAVAEALMHSLGVGEAGLLAPAYLDLLRDS